MTANAHAKFPPLAAIPDMCRHHAEARPSASASLFKGHEISYRELDWRANRIAQGLIAVGCGPGARVALLSKNSDICLEVLVGVLRARAVLLPLNWRLAVPEILYIVGHGQAQVLFVEEEFLPVGEQTREALTHARQIFVIGGKGVQSYEAWRDGQSDRGPELVCDPDEVALQLYTSGTTGLPKGVQLTHRNYTYSLGLALQLDWQIIEPGTTIFAPAPFFHLNGINPAIRSLHAGGRLLTIDQFRPPEVMAMFAQERVGRATLAPAMIQLCLDVPDAEHFDFSHLRLITYGGSPISQRVLARAKEVFGCDLAQAYGMTESSGAVTYLSPSDHVPARNKLLSCGLPLKGLEVRVVDPVTNAPCAVRAVGEVVVRGPMVTKGYWNDEKATAATIVDGWLRTGDAAYFDEEGYLYIHDRVKEMIVSGGENVYPAEVENALFHHPDVADVAVIGVPDDRWGESVKALIVRKPGTAPTQASIIDSARAYIGGYKIPKSVDFVDAIPRNAAGKILRRDLRKPFWENRERNVN